MRRCRVAWLLSNLLVNYKITFWKYEGNMERFTTFTPSHTSSWAVRIIYVLVIFYGLFYKWNRKGNAQIAVETLALWARVPTAISNNQWKCTQVIVKIHYTTSCHFTLYQITLCQIIPHHIRSPITSHKSHNFLLRYVTLYYIKQKYRTLTHLRFTMVDPK